MGGHLWTVDELTAVRALYPRSKWPELLKALPTRTKAAIRCQVIALGIKRERNSRTPWTGAERMALRKLWPNARWSELLAAIPRHPRTAIAKQAAMMRLRRDCAERRSKHRIIRELRQHRRALGIETRHLADRIGIHAVQLAKWERGEQLPRLQGFFDWIEALDFRLALTR